MTARDVQRARAAIGDIARHTPVVPSATLRERTGATVVLKAESLQRTGSFKVRGALNKLAASRQERLKAEAAAYAAGYEQPLAAGR